MKSLRTTSSKISRHSFLLLAHYATFAYQDMLFEYLNNQKARLVTKINLPLPELPNLHRMEIEECIDGKKTLTKSYWSMYKPTFLAYIFHLIQLFVAVISRKPTYDVVIAEDSSLAFVGITLRFFGKCKKVIFYSHGVDLTRFNNRLLDTVYGYFEKSVAQNSDINWTLSRLMLSIRQTHHKIPSNKLYWVPSSLAINTVRRLPEPQKRHSLVFLGVTNEKNGAHLLVPIIKSVRKKLKNVTLDIIGNGDMDNLISDQIKKEGLENAIRQLGVKEFKDFSQTLTNYALGLAPYLDRMDTLTARSDSMKMRVYLAAGLPVVITKGFHFSDEIAEFKLGKAVSFNRKAFSDAIIDLLTNSKGYKKIRKNALSYSEEYDIYRIYDKTFRKIFSERIE